MGKSPATISRLGVSRDFQEGRLFPSLTVQDNFAQLAAGMVEWKLVVEQLEEAECSPYPPARRNSLGAMTAKITKAVRAIEALEAMHDPVPVDKLVSALERLGNKYASAQQQEEALGMLVDEENVAGCKSGITGAGGDNKPRLTVEEKAAMLYPFYKRGKCRFSASTCV